MTNAAPAISVITIVKNNEELLPRAVDSVLVQSFTDFEHIIVNDGSTDGTTAIIDDYAKKDRRFKPKHMVQNVGRAMARNTGMDAAQGKYIFFLDSDDYLPETALMDIYEVAEEDNADIVYGRIKSFDPLNGRWIAKHYTDPLIEPELHGFHLEDKLALLYDHAIIGRLYRRQLLTANNITFSKVRKNGEDVLFSFYAAFNAKKLTTLPDKLSYFYSVGNYFATANEAKIFDARDNVLETLEFAIKYGSDAIKKSMLRKAAIFAANLNRVQIVYEGNKEKYMQYIKTLPPLIDGIPDDILNGLPPYHNRFAKAVILRNFEEAYISWEHENTPKIQSNKKLSNKTENFEKEIIPQGVTTNKVLDKHIVELQRRNKDLAYQLDRLYNTWSWRVTLPLRKIRRLIRWHVKK